MFYDSYGRKQFTLHTRHAKKVEETCAHCFGRAWYYCDSCGIRLCINHVTVHKEHNPTRRGW